VTYTKREIAQMGGHFGCISNWFLNMFAKSSDPTISELAKNELLVRSTRKENRPKFFKRNTDSQTKD